MSEKKTFKNPDLTVFADGSGWKITPEGVTQYSGSHKWFHANEWDMEVTFTRKVKPIEAGKWYYTGKRGEECSVYVLAIHGQMAWVTEDPDGLADGALTAWTEKLADIYS